MSSNATFSTFNPLSNQEGNGAIGSASDDLSNGNTKFNVTNGSSGMATTIATPSSGGKWYCEFYLSGSVGNYAWVGYYPIKETPEVKEQWAPSSNTTWTDTGIVSVHSMGRYFYTEGQYTDSGATSFTAGDVISIALDLDNGATYFAKNGTYMNSGNPASGSSKTGAAPVEGAYSKEYLLAVGSAGSSGHAWTINSGQDSTFGGNVSAGGNTDANGFGDFKYTVPSGYLALCSANVPVSDDINPAGDNGADENPTKQFNAIVWTGNRVNNSTVNNITGVGFQPDLVWLKFREQSYDWRYVDSSRGVTKTFRSNTSVPTQVESNGIYQFGSDGFSVKGDNNYNYNGGLFTGLCWKANGGTTSSNSDGNVTSTVQANQAAGFSIVTYTGTGSSGATVGHGLGATPTWMIVKNQDTDRNWACFHVDSNSSGQRAMLLNSNSSGDVSNYWNGTQPTSSIFSLGGETEVNQSGDDIIAYCWTDIPGYSKFGSYEGNGNSFGPFIYTGFRPRLIFFKRFDSTSGWTVVDTGRYTHNHYHGPGRIEWNLSNAETTGSSASREMSVLSNGVKILTDNSNINANGGDYIYGAWADVPFKFNRALP
jgi:hypothetical protein